MLKKAQDGKLQRMNILLGLLTMKSGLLVSWGPPFARPDASCSSAERKLQPYFLSAKNGTVLFGRHYVNVWDLKIVLWCSFSFVRRVASRNFANKYIVMLSN